MAIIHTAQIEGNYTVLPNALLRNANLSWKARGLLTYLLSLPPDWLVNLNHLTTQAPDGKDSLMTGFTELRKAGYIKAQRIRGEQGRYTGMEYLVYDEPQAPDEDYNNEPDNENEEQPINGITTTGKTIYGKTIYGKSAPTKYLVKEELINTNQLLLEADEKISENQNEIGKVFKAYEGEIGILTPMVSANIQEALEVDNIPPDWIVAAIGEASRNNKRNWAYVSAILKNWKANGFQTDKGKPQGKAKGGFKKPKYDMGDYEVSHKSEIHIVEDKDWEGFDGEVPF